MSKVKKKAEPTKADAASMAKLAKIHRKIDFTFTVDRLFRNTYFRVLTLILMGFTIFNTLHITLGVL